MTGAADHGPTGRVNSRNGLKAHHTTNRKKSCVPPDGNDHGDDLDSMLQSQDRGDLLLTGLQKSGPSHQTVNARTGAEGNFRRNLDNYRAAKQLLTDITARVAKAVGPTPLARPKTMQQRISQSIASAGGAAQLAANEEAKRAEKDLAAASEVTVG